MFVGEVVSVGVAAGVSVGVDVGVSVGADGLEQVDTDIGCLGRAVVRLAESTKTMTVAGKFCGPQGLFER